MRGRAAFERALLALQGPAPARCWRASRPAARPHDVHERRRAQCRRRAVLRHPLRLYRRGRVRDLGPRRRGRRGRAQPAGRAGSRSRSGSARATRCGSKPGSASTATISTRRRRRSRPVSPGRSASAAARRAAFPAPRDPAAQLAEGPPRKRVGIRPDGRAPAREGTEIVDAAGEPVGGSPAAASARRVGGAVAMGYVDAGLAADGTAARSWSCAASRCRRRSSPLPFVPHRYHRLTA